MGRTRPQFSILIPTTGRIELIRMAIESVRAQTFPDFEIVVADSSGSDETRRAVLSRGDARIRYIFASPASGPLAPFDIAAKEARGNYILWLDDDNYLLPFALEILKRGIKDSGANIITANHLYYYDDRHPRYHLRNSLGVIPFTGKCYSINPRDAIKSLLSFSKRGPGLALPRFHVSATTFSRTVVEKAIGRLGYVLFPDMPNAHSLQPILFAFATSCYFIDHPIVIVGRLGVSMSQVWSTAARKRFKKTPFVPTYSPLNAYTRLNGILENYLRVKQRLADLIGDIPIDYERFAPLYLDELLFLDTDFVTAFRNWKNFFAFLKNRSPETYRRLRSRAIRYMLLVIPLFCIRRARIHHLWRYLRGIFLQMQTRNISPTARMGEKQEFAIPLPASSRIDSIATLARHIREILLDQTGRDIFVLPHS